MCSIPAIACLRKRLPRGFARRLLSMTHHDHSADHARLDRLLGFLAQDPDNTSLLIDTLSLAISSQAIAAAQTLKAHVTRHGIDNAVAHAHLAHLLLLAGDYVGAALQGDLAIAAGIIHPAVLFNTAFGHFHAADYASSASTLARVTNQPDASLPALLLHARALGALRRELLNSLGQERALSLIHI